MRRLTMARTRAALLAVGVTLVGGGLFGLAPGPATASGHREAPLISGQPQYDNTDVYAFVSPDRPDTTTLIANWVPFEDPSGGPNFYKFATDARYDINIDSDGNSQPDYTFRWTFTDHYRSGNTFLYNTGPVRSLTDPNLNFLQTYDLTVLKQSNGHVVSQQTLATNVPVAPSNVGKASMPDYGTLRKQALHPLTGGGAGGWANGGQVFAGQADDPFFLDLRVFDLLYGGNLSEVGNDTLRGYNVNSVALQVPTNMLTAAKSQPTIGIWSDTQRRGASGWYTQVSRLGMPLVNEVVIPLKDKDRFNASAPWNDARFGPYVTDPEQKLNPVVTEILTQLTTGAPQTIYNGGLQLARVRYDDLDQGRPGLPPDVAALLESLDATTATVRLLNLSSVATRRLRLRAGAFGEHLITTARWETGTSTDVYGNSVDITLPPGHQIRLCLDMRLNALRAAHQFPDPLPRRVIPNDGGYGQWS